MEVEDDLLFADLSRQISLLIMDDDDEDPVSRNPNVSFQAFSRAAADYVYHHPTAAPSPFLYEQKSCRRSESKGTGVFIPQSSQPRRRKNNNRRQGRFSSRQHDHKTRTVSQSSSTRPEKG